VLRYALPGLPDRPAAAIDAASIGGVVAAGSGSSSAAGKCWALDGALPPPLLRFAREFLSPRSVFWAEHGYSIHGIPRPYFSYLHPLEDVRRQVRVCAHARRVSVCLWAALVWWSAVWHTATPQRLGGTL
jgi:hypothetical protein